MTRYAEGTTVPVAKTKGEILELLVTHGASHYGFGTETLPEPGREIVAFSLRGLNYRFEVERPTWTAVARTYANPERVQNRSIPVEREWMRRWRARLLWLKATLEFADGDSGETARLLLPFLVLPSGDTMATWAADQMVAIKERRMPLLLTAGE